MCGKLTSFPTMPCPTRPVLGSPTTWATTRPVLIGPYYSYSTRCGGRCDRVEGEFREYGGWSLIVLNRHSPDRTTFPGYSSRRDAANYNLAFQGRQMRPDSLKFLLSWTNHRPAKRKISKPLVYDQVSSLGSPFALYDPVTVINPDAPKVD